MKKREKRKPEINIKKKKKSEKKKQETIYL